METWLKEEGIQMKKRRTSGKLFGKLLFSALLWVVGKLLEPVPVLRTMLNVVAFAA